MVDLWARCRDTVACGVRHLPGPGGYGDQPAALLDAFAILDEAFRDATA